MNSGGRIILAAAFIFIAVVARAQSFSLLSATPTNSIAANYNVTNTNLASTGTNVLGKYAPSPWIGKEEMESYSNEMAPPAIYGTNLIPLIEFEDVPLTVAFYNLVRQSHIKYLLDPQIDYGQTDSQGEIQIEPLVTTRLENVTVTYAFLDICTNCGFKVVQDPETGVVFVRNRNHGVNFVTSAFYNNDTNLIPLIEFQDVSPSIILKILAKQTGLKYIFSPRIDPWQLGNEPQITIRWENMTARQAFAALCENYDLNIIKYPDSGIIRVEPSD